ncbi:MAG: YceH family protein [Planctomycetota bacterium]
MTPELQLDPTEARVLGVLIEKELTTPEQYPLTLNAATNGSNQKNNRDPVLELTEHEVEASLRKMTVKGFVGSVHPVGSRVEKFRHNAGTVLAVEKPQLAVLAELLLRGPQQPGELRGRASRMAPIESLGTLAEILGPLIEAKLVVRLDPTPGSRAERYAQTLTGAVAAARAPARPAPLVEIPRPVEAPAPAPVVGEQGHPLAKRVEELEFNVSRLRRQLDNLAWKLGEKLEG